MKNISWRLLVIVGLMLSAVVLLMPTVDMVANKKKQPTLWPNKKINLGLDLQGGMYLDLEVKTEEAVKGSVERLVNDLSVLAEKQRIGHAGIEQLADNSIQIKIKSQESIDKFKKLLEKEFRGLELTDKSDNDYTYLNLALPAEEKENIKRFSVEQALETIRNRIDALGVSEPDIRRQGERQILVQLPGIEDPDRAKELIGKTALLEFRLLDDRHDRRSSLNGKAPRGTELLEAYARNGVAQGTERDYLVKKRTSLTGADLTDARVQYNQDGTPYVSLKFNKKGSRIFARITEKNVNKRLAIVLDAKVYSAPSIRERIGGGRAMIEGGFTLEDAQDLAIALRAGALPAPVEAREERTVGPSLGQDSIDKGLKSMLIGGLLVVLFMMLYYRVAGLIADLALFLNLVLVAAGLAFFDGTLTLPGIAGIILTIGMAVDANVLIFERVKEELRLGKTARAAVDAGYERATLTILDANVTTLIVAIVLLQFGTGPVRGFAVTLILGILASLFTALIMTRAIFEYILMKRSGNVDKPLSI